MRNKVLVQLDDLVMDTVINKKVNPERVRKFVKEMKKNETVDVVGSLMMLLEDITTLDLFPVTGLTSVEAIEKIKEATKTHDFDLVSKLLAISNNAPPTIKRMILDVLGIDVDKMIDIPEFSDELLSMLPILVS